MGKQTPASFCGDICPPTKPPTQVDLPCPILTDENTCNGGKNCFWYGRLLNAGGGYCDDESPCVKKKKCKKKDSCAGGADVSDTCLPLIVQNMKCTPGMKIQEV